MIDFEVFSSKNITSSPQEDEFSKVRNPLIVGVGKEDSVDHSDDFLLVDKSWDLMDIPKLFNEVDSYIKLETIFEEEMKFLENLSDISNFSKKDLIREIISFKALKQSWDGYNALPLEVESALNAIQLIEYIGEKSISRLEEIFPNPNGTVSFRWANEFGVNISLEVGNKTMSYYIEIEEGKPEFFNQILINQNEGDKLAQIIERYF
jgi:hypothetical protein